MPPVAMRCSKNGAGNYDGPRGAGGRSTNGYRGGSFLSCNVPRIEDAAEWAGCASYPGLSALLIESYTKSAGSSKNNELLILNAHK